MLRRVVQTIKVLEVVELHQLNRLLNFDSEISIEIENQIINRMINNLPSLPVVVRVDFFDGKRNYHIEHGSEVFKSIIQFATSERASKLSDDEKELFWQYEMPWEVYYGVSSEKDKHKLSNFNYSLSIHNKVECIKTVNNSGYDVFIKGRTYDSYRTPTGEVKARSDVEELFTIMFSPDCDYFNEHFKWKKQNIFN